MATYGYARVSTKDQNVNRQLDALERFPLERSSIYIDYYTGADFERPEYQRLVRRLEQGDVLVVKSIDRLGRNYSEILAQWDRLTRSQGVQVVVPDMPLLDTRQTARDLTGTFIADVVLQLLSYVAQVERENIRQRQAEGIAAAKARGVRFGRPEKARPQEYADVRNLVAMGELSKRRRKSISNLQLVPTLHFMSRQRATLSLLSSSTIALLLQRLRPNPTVAITPQTGIGIPGVKI
ncbi:resolvase [Collinsella sp. An7]|uniref:recombinase family protein n=1 Tax=Collinsella sp. An7 TaxID=1965651 RepID=UPI000B3A0776|nr:recombinase family protein [Collinsella sp. An7]OUN48068.1 resolvase [Collinsella sp. An7]